MKIIKLISAFVCGVLACLSWQMFADCGIEPRTEEKVPTIKEIQELIGCEKIDGKLGPDTQAKWDKAVGDRHAAKWHKPETYKTGD